MYLEERGNANGQFATEVTAKWHVCRIIEEFFSHRCAHCLTCGANEPGVNCFWLKNYTECGPCASRVTCPSCQQSYNEGDLIIKCETCER